MASPTYVLVLVSVLGLPAPAAAAPPSREITREMRAPSAEICSENDGRPPPVLPVPLAFVFVFEPMPASLFADADAEAEAEDAGVRGGVSGVCGCEGRSLSLSGVACDWTCVWDCVWAWDWT